MENKYCISYNGASDQCRVLSRSGMFSKLFLITFVLLLIQGCTSSKEDTSKLSLAIPSTLVREEAISSNTGQANKMNSKALTFSTALKLAHVIINVSWPNNPNPILLAWDACRDCLNPPPVPTQFYVEVPQGDQRLIQVLAVYMDEDKQSMYFYYGDSGFVSLVLASQDVNIPVNSIGGAQQMVSSMIAGRYFTSENAGPTGVVNVKYYPPNKPSMVIERSHIVNGWFNLFALKGVEFSYELDDGTKVFGSSITPDSPLFNPTDKVLKVTKPIHKRNDSWDSGTSNWKNAEPEIAILGWFGADTFTTGKVVCRNFATTLTKEARYDNTATMLTFINQAPLSDLYVSADHVFYEGGISSSDSPCTTGNNFVQFLSTASANYDGKGKESFAGFYSPFMMNENGNPIAITQGANANRVLSGKLIPGITQIQKLLLFKQVGPQVSNMNVDQVACDAIARGLRPEWIPAGEASVNTVGEFSLSSTVSSADITAMTVGALCFAGPLGVYPYGIGIRSSHWSGSGGSGGGSSGPYLMIEGLWQYVNWQGSTLSQTKDLRQGDCIPVSFNTYINGSPYPLTKDHTIAFTPGQGFTVHSDLTTCISESAPVPSITMSASKNRFPINPSDMYYIRIPNSATSVTFGLNVSTSSGSSDFNYQALGPLTASNISPPTKLFIRKLNWPQRAAIRNNCETYEVYSGDINGNEISSFSDVSFTISASPSVSNFYNEGPDCSGTSYSNFTIPAYHTSKRISFYVPSLGSPLSIFLTAITFPLTFSSFSIPMKDNTSKFMKINLANRLVPNTCYPFDISLFSSNFSVATSDSAVSVYLSSTNSSASFYDSLTNCNSSSPSVGFVQITSGSHSSNPAYVRFSSTGMVSITADSSPLSDIVTESFEIASSNMGSSSVSRLSITGPYEITSSQCQTMILVTTNTYGYVVPTPAELSATVSSADTGAKFYSSDDCTNETSSPASVSIPANSYYGKIYFKSTGNAGTNGSIQININGTSLQTSPFNYYVR